MYDLYSSLAAGSNTESAFGLVLSSAGAFLLMKFIHSVNSYLEGLWLLVKSVP